MKLRHRPKPRSYLPVVTLRNCRYIPGALRVSSAVGTEAARVYLDYRPHTEVMACKVPTQLNYYRARRYAEDHLLPAQCFEEEGDA